MHKLLDRCALEGRSTPLERGRGAEVPHSHVLLPGSDRRETRILGRKLGGNHRVCVHDRGRGDVGKKMAGFSRSGSV